MGAKLINEAVSNGILSQKQGQRMLNYCVNAGPGFIVSAVGNALLGSNTLGIILLISHILASLTICRFSGKIEAVTTSKAKALSPAENFVVSASESATAVTGICAFVILFSVITAYLEHFSAKFNFLVPLLYLCEVTNAVTKTRNIYLISFLLGFSGICIWCQVMSVGKAINIKALPFVFSRLIHGSLSLLYTFIILKIHPVTLPVFSNFSAFSPAFSVSGKALSLSLIVMSIVFVISLSGQKRKVLEEFV